MKAQIAILAVAAALFAASPAGAVSYASGAPMGAASISAGPQLPENWPGNSWDETPQAELTYLHNVCPTVDAHPGSYSATLDRFCHEVRG